MIVHYGPPDISKLDKELRKLGIFSLPSRREVVVMEFLYEKYRRTEQNKPIRVLEIFKALNISGGQDVGTLNDSRFLEKELEGTHETFKLSSDGVRYMDYFFGLIYRRYEDLDGAIRNGEMLNPEKRERARQWAKERMVEIVSGIPSTPVSQQNISGVFFEVGGNMRNDGTILTDKNTIVGVNVQGNYTSKKGEIIQGRRLVQLKPHWHQTWWGVLIIGIVVTVVGSLILAVI